MEVQERRLRPIIIGLAQMPNQTHFG